MYISLYLAIILLRHDGANMVVATLSMIEFDVDRQVCMEETRSRGCRVFA